MSYACSYGRPAIRPSLTISHSSQSIGDLSRPETLRSACLGMDAIVHSAAILRAADTREFMRANREGTKSLALAAADSGVQRFVNISSLAAQGPSPDGVAEPAGTMPHPVSAYGRSKLEGERVLEEVGERIDVINLRPPLVYGPGDTGLLAFFWMARRGFAIRLGDGSRLVDAIYGPDLADAVAALLEAGRPTESCYYVSDPQGPFSWNDLLSALADVAGRRLLIPSFSAGVFHGIARCSEWWAKLSESEPMLDRTRVLEMRQAAWLCDSTALTRDTGWQARTALQTGLTETMSWYREQGWV